MLEYLQGCTGQPVANTVCSLMDGSCVPSSRIGGGKLKTMKIKSTNTRLFDAEDKIFVVFSSHLEICLGGKPLRTGQDA